ncbi:MAG: trigger factor [Pseudomonadota bacterium]
MQVTETLSEGLKRELEIVVEAQELDQKLVSKLEQLKETVRIKGFRPGKVPIAHLRRVYGEQVMVEVVQKTLHETVQKALKERDERPAFEPEITLTENKEEIQKIISGNSNLAIKMSFEIMPSIELADFSKLEFEKQVAEITEDEIQESLERIANNNMKYVDKEGPLEIDDQASVDFVGKIDGEPFEGGSAEDANIVIGRNAFIPGFEEGLIGLEKDQEHNLNITFPENYSAKHLAGRDAVFEITVKNVQAPEKQDVDDEFAKSLGLENLEKLREVVVKEIQQQHDEASKIKLKKSVLDVLNEEYSFELPPTLVMQEFDDIWKQLTEEMENAGKTFEDEDTTEDKKREECYQLSERRVKLGLLLNEIGEKNDIKVNEDEVRNAMFERARQFPGMERKILELYQKNPESRAQLQAPIFEEKIINLIVETAKVTDKDVSVEVLHDMSDEDADATKED